MREYDINGVIVANDDAWIYDWCDMEYTAPKDLKQFLEIADGEAVVININSGGGDLYAGVNMHDILKAYNGDCEIHIQGLAASAASVIAMARTCMMSAGSQMMIHNVSCTETSNKNGKAKISKELASHDKGVAAVYEAKSGMSAEEILKLMDKETWLDAKTALELHLIDGITGVETQPVFTNAATATIPEAVIRKMREMKQIEKPTADTGIKIKDLKTKLEFMRR